MQMKKPINVRIGSNIRVEREKAGYTQETLSEILGITPNHLSAIERGVSGASLEMIDTLCTLFGITSDTLFFGNKEQTDYSAKIALQLGRIKPEYRPQVQKMLSALIEIILKQGK